MSGLVIGVEGDPSGLDALARVGSEHRCLAHATQPVDVLVLTGTPEARTVEQRRHQLVDATIVVWDRSGRAAPATIGAALAAGCDAFVGHPDPEVLLANIDAVRRRTTVRASGRMCPRPG